MKKLCPKCELPLSPVGEDSGVCVCGWTGRLRDGLTEPRLMIPAPAMPYVSIDLETTGLSSETCQILEFGAVYDDWTTPVSELPTFHRIITHDTIVGQPYALSMHSDLLRRTATRKTLKTCPECGNSLCLLDAEFAGYGFCLACEWTGSLSDHVFCSAQRLVHEFTKWMLHCSGLTLPKNKITPAGKNFASFDNNFLKQCGFDGCFHHRTFDPAPLYWQLGDKTMPDTKTCMERAGLDGHVAHTALEDAVTVVHLIRRGVARLSRFFEPICEPALQDFAL
jgi:hypothetical protein